jgi:DNA gyrase subunit A
MAVLHHDDSSTDKRMAYIKRSNAERAALGDDVEDDTSEEEVGDTMLTDAEYGEMGAREEFILSLADDGFGKRTSSYHYATKRRGGKGLIAQNLERGKGEDDAKLVRSFVIEDDNQIMIVTDGGQLIRCPVRNIRIVGRSSRGVTVIRTKSDERVVSVERIEESEEDEAPEVVENGPDA